MAHASASLTPETRPSRHRAARAPTTAALRLKNVGLRYQTRTEALSVLGDVTMDVPESSFMTILGPNGCGKSSLLRILAGLMLPTQGEVLERGEPVRGVAHTRLLMFQRPTLFPWMTLRRNIEFALRSRNVEASEREQRLESFLALVGLEEFHKAYPWELSAGMQQRAELARALAVGPRILLMDEPFASLDSLSREMFQEELLRILDVSPITFVMVTHDVREALFLGDQVCLLSGRPSRVKETIRCPVKREEREDWRKSAEFSALAMHLLSLLRRETEG